MLWTLYQCNILSINNNQCNILSINNNYYQLM